MVSKQTAHPLRLGNKKSVAQLKAELVRKRKKQKELQKKFAHFSKSIASLRSVYVIFSLFILTSTTLLWALLGARLQQSNADEVVEGSLFRNFTTFHTAILPSAHTFLIKWPLFFIAGMAGNTSVATITLTVIVSVLTVTGLVFVLYRIDSRPRVFGSLLLALSCMLLLIPAQPHLGGLLPVNFAMLATRNVEYIFYIIAIVLLLNSKKFKSGMFIAGSVLFGLLFASDKLFQSLALGSAVLIFIMYFILRRKALVLLALRLFVMTIIGIVIAAIVIWIISITKLTNISNEGNSPYSLTTGVKELGSGIVFALLGILTNVGANPIFDIGVIKSIPSTFISRLEGPQLIPFLLNILVFAVGIIGSVKVVALSLVKPKRPRWNAVKIPPAYTKATALSIVLIASTITALGAFIFTNHYYPVDSRYETIVLFALFIVLATYIRSRPLPVWLGKWNMTILFLVAIVIACVWTVTTNQQQQSSLSNINSRNQKIADVLQNHKTDLLVGDYWRVVPISQLDTDKTDSVLPLANCTTPRDSLISTSWEANLKTHSFTYLLSLDKSLTDFPQCSIAQIVNNFGRPNASTLIAGTNEHPQELLLFYDGGITKDRPLTKGASYATILPSALKPIDTTTQLCAANTTIMNIVAHQDDDLLFMNPDLLHEIEAGDCIRTVYVTAGDAGQGSVYWIGREQGSEAAYDSLLGIPETTIWVQKTVKLAENEYISVVNPIGNRKVSLIFMLLSDGNINGSGFPDSDFESIAKLYYHRIPVVETVDRQSSYTAEQLTTALTQLMTLYQPTILHTQAPRDYGTIFHDHSDHITVGKFVTNAFAAYPNHASVPITYYVGYPIRQRPEDVTGADLIAKTNAFLAYARFDGGVCQSLDACDTTPTYDAYLHRQYTTDQF
jgi:LmbE family N-acetylglucosaminyl deacetylase